MIREINVSEITAAVKEMCIQANHFLSPDMDKARVSCNFANMSGMLMNS